MQRGLSLLLLLIALTLGINRIAIADAAELQIKQNSSGECVAPVEEMRRNHMGLLFKQRDQVVELGIRDKKFSFDRCISCHGSQDAVGNYVPINAKGEFCQSCHAYASVRIDCFECHASVPDKAMK